MGEYSVRVAETEKKFKHDIDTRVTSLLNQANNEKIRYDKVVESCTDVTAQIKTIVEKFDVVKSSIQEGDKKVKGYSAEIDNIKLENELLVA